MLCISDILLAHWNDIMPVPSVFVNVRTRMHVILPTVACTKTCPSIKNVVVLLTSFQCNKAAVTLVPCLLYFCQFVAGLVPSHNWPGGCLNMKMSSYQYRNSHYKNKIVSWLSYLFNWNPYTGRGWCLCIESAHRTKSKFLLSIQAAGKKNCNS